MTKEKGLLLAGGGIVGLLSIILVKLGNPANMGFCIACFIRDIAGGLGMHQAAVVQYVRPEILGLVCGSFIIALIKKDFQPRGGSSPVIRFILGVGVMFGALVFLGCPLRMALRIAGGDLNAIVGLVGFVAGILVGVVFLQKGFSLGRNYQQGCLEGMASVGIIISILIGVLGVVLIAVPNFSVSLLCRLGGGILILFGIVKIIGYCSNDLYRLAFQYDLAIGILLIALGAILILRTRIMTSLICVLLGIYTLADALLKIQISVDSKAFGICQWWLILVVAIITGVVGFLLVFRPSENARIVMILLGLALLMEGALNFITVLTSVKVNHHQPPIVTGSEHEEIK